MLCMSSSAVQLRSCWDQQGGQPLILGQVVRPQATQGNPAVPHPPNLHPFLPLNEQAVALTRSPLRQQGMVSVPLQLGA